MTYIDWKTLTCHCIRCKEKEKVLQKNEKRRKRYKENMQVAANINNSNIDIPICDKCKSLKSLVIGRNNSISICLVCNYDLEKEIPDQPM